MVPVRPAPIADFAGGLRPLNAPRARDISSIRLHPSCGRREAQAGRGRAGIPPIDIAPLRNGESPEGDGTVMARAEERRMRETGDCGGAVHDSSRRTVENPAHG